MAGNRKKAEAFIVGWIREIERDLSDKPNSTFYEKVFFPSMTDAAFDQYMNDLESGQKFLVLIYPNFNKSGKLSTSNNLRVAEALGHNFFQKLWIEGTGDMETYLTPVPYLIVDLPLRRASQLLIKKISVPDDMKTVNALTGQPTGESKGAKISSPELQICAAMGLDNSMVELMKYRGGDLRGLAAYRGMISKYGRASIQALQPYASGVESTKTLYTLLTSAHLKSTLNT